MLMHLFLIYYGIPMIIDRLAERYGWAFQSSSIPILVFVLIAFSLTAGAYMSEIPFRHFLLWISASWKRLTL